MSSSRGMQNPPKVTRNEHDSFFLAVYGLENELNGNNYD